MDRTQSKYVRFIPDMGYDITEREDMPERTQITSEICVRLLELKDCDATSPILLMTKLLRLYRADPFCFWIAVEVLSGDRLQAKSLASLGREQMESKQATHQRQNRALATIEKVMPEVADALREILTRKPILEPKKKKNSPE